MYNKILEKNWTKNLMCKTYSSKVYETFNLKVKFQLFLTSIEMIDGRVSVSNLVDLLPFFQIIVDLQDINK